MKTFSIKEVLGAGWKAFTANLSIFVTYGVLMLAVWLFERIGGSIGGALGPFKPAFLALVSLVARVAHLWLQLGLLRLSLRLVEGQPVSVDDIIQGPAPDFLSFLLASVLYGLIVGGGMLLLIVPGVIWAVRYWAYGFAIASEHVDPLAALKRSSALTEGLRGELFVFGLAMIGVNIVGAMALGVGLLATIPVTAIASAQVYRILVARTAARTNTATPPVDVNRPAEVH